MDTVVEQQDGTRRVFQERLTLYHANSQGTGAAVQLEPRINRRAGERYNCFFLEMAPQKTAQMRTESGLTPATFDWERKITVKLNFMDICELLAVLEGESDHVGGGRDGLYHQTGEANTIIRFCLHDAGGYRLALSRKCTASGEVFRVGTVLSRKEAIGLRHIFQAGLFFVTLPMASHGLCAA